MKVTLTHVYSRANAGDGLLADLSSEIIREAFGVQPTFIAIDTAGFDSSGGVLAFAAGRRRPQDVLKELPGLAHPNWTQVGRAISQADLTVGIGGGYLRSTSARGLAVLMATHGVQLGIEARSARQLAFLPMSVGPNCGVVSSLLRRALGRASLVCLRDDRSFAELRSVPNVRRVPDLAALELGATHARGTFKPTAPPNESVLLQFRPVSSRPDLLEIVRQFSSQLTSPMVHAVQSTSGKNNDDREFGRLIGGAEPRPLKELLADENLPVSVAVCGRLHAAMACILAGVPTIHVPYERKGYGVFADIGLSDYVVPPDLLVSHGPELVNTLLRDSSSYWRAVSQQIDTLSEHRRQLITGLQHVLA